MSRKRSAQYPFLPLAARTQIANSCRPRPLSQLQTAIVERVGARPGHPDRTVELDMLAWMTRTALELIGQAGLGYSFDPLVADAMDEFGRVVKSFGCVLLPPL